MTSPPVPRNENFTFKANMNVGRHGWLRLTPAYGVKLVREKLSALPSQAVVTDPFSGSGTTALAAAEFGHIGQAFDVNPFLVWLGNTKLTHYTPETLTQVNTLTADIVNNAHTLNPTDLWTPNIHNITRWWSTPTLNALTALRAELDTLDDNAARDLLTVAFCRAVITSSNAAFNHQSMSFRSTDPAPTQEKQFTNTLKIFQDTAHTLANDAATPLAGSGSIFHANSTTSLTAPQPADLLLTSPPYVNRMSYIRELRPYLYWTRYLTDAPDAGKLDWQAIGGTWGTATSNLTRWTTTTTTPVDDSMFTIMNRIATSNGKQANTMATYVHKYFVDMWTHFQQAQHLVKPGGTVSYIIGNSTFYGNDVPAQTWFADMLRALNFTNVKVTVIRKRNSNKALYEYDVTGTRPG
jgi:hypothetical protein